MSGKAETLRAAYATWKASPRIDTTEAMMQDCIPYARSVVRSVLITRDDLWDEAESSSLVKIFENIDDKKENITAWVRTVCRNTALDCLRQVTRSKIDPEANLDVIPRKQGMDLSGLTDEEQLVARLLSQGNSQRQIMADTGISRRRLKAAMAAIAEHLTPAGRKVALAGVK